MTGGLAEVLDPGRWPAFTLVSARVGGMMLTGPFWSMAAMPASVKAAVAVVLSLGLLAVVPAPALPADYAGLVVPLGTELLIGVGIGLAASLFLDGVAIAGEVASVQMGLNLGEALGLVGAGETAGVGQYKTRGALVVFVAVGGHLLVLAALAQSFGRIPPGAAIDLARGGEVLTALAGTVFETGVRAAAPVMASMVLVNLGLAVLGRAVPQLNVMVFSFPLTIGLGLLVLAATAPYLARFAGEWVAGVLPRAAAVVDALAGGR